MGRSREKKRFDSVRSTENLNHCLRRCIHSAQPAGADTGGEGDCVPLLILLFAAVIINLYPVFRPAMAFARAVQIKLPSAAIANWLRMRDFSRS